MKTYLITFASFFLFIFTSTAQDNPGPKSTLKVGFGTAYLGTGDYFGKHRFVEYDRSLLKFLSLGLSGAWTKASKNEGDSLGNFLNTKAWQGDANLYLAPIHNNVNRLRFGGGVSYRHSETEYGEFAPIVKANALGYSLVADYEFYIVRHIVIGTRAAFQKYENNDKVFYWGLNAGIRF